MVGDGDERVSGPLGRLRGRAPFGAIVPPWGPSFTYRALLLAVFMFPILSLGWTLEFFEPINVHTALWFFGVVFYAVGGTAWKWIIEWLGGRGGRAGGDLMRFCPSWLKGVTGEWRLFALK